MVETQASHDAKQYSPLALAFLGDAVYELCVRSALIGYGQRPVDALNRRKVELVNAAAQSRAFEKIEPLLSPEELAIYKRGRNGHTGSVPKNAAVADYRRATGVEALFGYLFLQGEYARIRSLFACMMEEETDERETD